MNLCTEPDRQKGGSGEKQGLSLRLAAIFLRNQSIQSLHMLFEVLRTGDGIQSQHDSRKATGSFCTDIARIHSAQFFESFPFVAYSNE